MNACDKIRAAVDSIAWGVRYQVDAFAAAVHRHGGTVTETAQIMPIEKLTHAQTTHVLARAKGPGWACVLVQVGTVAKVVQEQP